ncbi:5793_t:CDS:10 [Ambispora gerdemannii]|uniref:5793_t:CDS:1 n=1 Tax=Ambispora gerdemannii TaxID=144530 RepID=A0A9N8WDQ3_9GLOM|nr:5793_t:CDS:10 [Ambispora gerdemannii]
MQKPSKWNVADTNLANFGSKLEKDVHHAAAEKEQAWADPSIGPWPKDKYGRFYSGDSYIVLHVSWKRKNKDSEALSHDIHFWLGLESSQDEVGTAAYKTVELDDFLGTSPTQHREVQGHESKLFFSYFNRFIVEEGGIASGFKHTEPKTYRPRLLKLKQVGRTVVIREVPKDYRSLNSGDVFVLDTGITLYQLNGKNSQGAEKVKAAEFVRAVEAERNGATNIIVIDEGDREMPKFWEALGSKGEIKSADADVGTEAAHYEKKLYRLSDASGQIKFTQEATGSIRKSHFDTNDVFLYDAGFEVFIWVGKNSTVKEKRYALDYAQKYIKEHARPEFTPISRVVEGGENEILEKRIQEDMTKKKTSLKLRKIPFTSAFCFIQYDKIFPYTLMLVMYALFAVGIWKNWQTFLSSIIITKFHNEEWAGTLKSGVELLVKENCKSAIAFHRQKDTCLQYNRLSRYSGQLCARELI